MKELLLYIARNLVDDPEAVSVTEVEGPQELTLELRVAPDDMGKVIGRQGRIAKEIRTVIRSYAQRTGQKVSVDITDHPAGRFRQIRKEEARPPPFSIISLPLSGLRPRRFGQPVPLLTCTTPQASGDAACGIGGFWCPQKKRKNSSLM